MIFQLAFCDAPRPWQMSFQDPATPAMEGLIDLHHYAVFFLLIVVTVVSYIMFRIIFLYNYKANPQPIDFGEDVTLEVIWTITPIFILIAIMIPSFSLLYSMEEVIDPTLTVKAIGHQWYWTYEYSDYKQPDGESITFDSYMVPEEDLEPGQLRLLEVDNPLVLPTNTHICLVVTASDVIHSWAVPSLGIKLDGLPGRLNQVNLFIQREGVFYGQCSEICGSGHGFMPIVVKAVPVNEYVNWVSEQQNS